MTSPYSFRPLVKTLKEVVTPTLGEAVLSIVAACIILFLAFFEHFSKLITGDNPQSQEYFQKTIDGYLSDISSLPLAQYSTQTLVWGLVGAGAYVLLLTVVDILITFRNIIIREKGGSLSAKLDSFSLFDEYRRAVWIGAVIILLVITFSTLLPMWFDLFKTGVDGSIFATAASVIGIAVNLYFIYMLTWVAIRNPNMLARK